MPIVLTAILWAAFAGAGAVAVRTWHRQLEAGRRQDLEALAARRGWSLSIAGERLGRVGSLRLAPRGGHPWRVETHPGAVRRPGPSTEFESGEPVWAQGTMVLTLASDASPSHLRVFEREAAGLPNALPSRHVADGLAIVTDGEPWRRVDLADLRRVLLAWAPIVPGARGAPIVVLSPRGLRVGLGHAVRRADHMERFVDLALDLSRIIGP